jgi:hypothetical protein
MRGSNTQTNPLAGVSLLVGCSRLHFDVFAAALILWRPSPASQPENAPCVIQLTFSLPSLLMQTKSVLVTYFPLYLASINLYSICKHLALYVS